MYFAILLICVITNASPLCANGYQAKYQQAPHLSYVNTETPLQDHLNLPINQLESFTPFSLFAKQHPELIALEFETLLKSPADDKACYYPLLATPIKVSEDAITLSINPNAHFHDGSHITVEDIAYSIKMAKNSPTWQKYAQPIQQIIQSSSTFRITHDGDWHDIISALGNIPIVQKNTQLGSGPYQLSQQTSKKLDFTKQDHYWGKKHWLNIGRNLYQQVTYHFISHPALLQKLLSKKIIDLYPVYNAKQWHLVAQSFSEETSTLSQNYNHYTQYLLFNTKDHTLEFREAIFALIDAAQINQYLCFNQYQNIVPKPTPANTGLNILSTNESKTLKLVVLSKWLHIGEAIVHQLQQYQIKAELITLPSTAYAHRLRSGQYDLTIVGIEQHPLMHYSDLFATYITPPIAYQPGMDITDYQNQLIQQSYLLPLWRSTQYKIHHDKKLKLDHLDGLDELDLLSSWKIK